MSIKESALNTITALTNSDFIRMVTSAGASRKATLQNIAQHVIESYTGSSLAGKNQSVKAALDGLNSTTVSITPADGVTLTRNTSARLGRLVVINAYFTCDSLTANASTTVGTIEAAARPSGETAIMGFDPYTHTSCDGWVTTGGLIRVVPPNTATNRQIRVAFCFMAA